MKSFIFVFSFFASSIVLACAYGSICRGDRIIDRSDSVGEVLEVFNNGKARVTLDGLSYSYTRNLSELGKGVRSHKHVGVGDRIIDSNDLTGEVIELFDNGKARVSLDGFNYSYIRNVLDLGKGYRCIANICQGDRIVDSSDNYGSAIELFDNGKAKVSLDGYNIFFIRTFDSLDIELNCRLRVNCSCRN